MFDRETFAQAVNTVAYLLNAFANFSPVKTDLSPQVLSNDISSLNTLRRLRTFATEGTYTLFLTGSTLN